MASLLITGCSTGFGRVTTLHMLRRGWRVIATVRKHADRDSLIAEASAAGHSGNLVVAIADITKAADVAALGDTIAKEAPKLDALVNNAGTGYPAPLELLAIDDFRAQLEINLVAHLAVTQVALPALKAARGTIINVSSVAGRIASPLLGAYHISKFGLEAMSDTLRLELIPFGIRVAVIEPGSSPTTIWETSARNATAVNRAGIAPYQKIVDHLNRFMEHTKTHGFPPRLFADTVEKILSTENPKPRYPIPADIRRRLLIRKLVSDRMMDRLIRWTLKW